MSTKMNWSCLLSPERRRESRAKKVDFRNNFDMDYERVVSSSALRRLQDKAQVFPLQENDFTRTRLTHSLEVSSIGRSIGARIGYELKKRDIFKLDQDKELSSLLAVSGLVHDLGNPPFGHYGEDIIREWFKNNKSRLFNDEEWVNDFLYFDGNAQTIRILSKLQYMSDYYGMNFCYGTLGTLLKYPWSSKEAKSEKSDKMGYFISEEDLFNAVVEKTGMLDKEGKILRHPATYLLEAADDIAYLFADLEDAVKKDYAIWEEVKKEIFEVANALAPFKGLEEKIKEIEEKNCECLPSKDCEAIEAMYFRVLCQGICIECICKEFLDNYEDIMNGKYNKKALCKSELLEKIIGIVRKKCIKYAYQNSEVLSLEIIGKSVLTSLLDKYIHAAIDDENYENLQTESGKLYKMISPNFELIQKFDSEGKYCSTNPLTKYQRTQLVVDYISGMTDSYALNLHKILLGMKLP